MKAASLLIVPLCILFCVPHAVADTILLKNGRSMRGIIKNEEGDNVVMVIPGGALTFPKSSIQSIERSSSEANRQQRMQWAADSVSKTTDTDEESSGQGAGTIFPGGGNRIYISATLNRGIPVTLLLDTGAPYVIIRKGLASKLGVSLADGAIVEVSLAGKTVKAVQTTIRDVSVGGFQVTNAAALILLQDINFTDMRDGLLGMSFLNNFSFKIDYETRQLILDVKATAVNKK